MTSYQGMKSVGFNEAQGVATQILDGFEADEFDICTLYFAEFQSVISQTPTARQIIPASIDAAETPDFHRFLNEIFAKRLICDSCDT